MSEMIRKNFDKLQVHVYENREQMGTAAAHDVIQKMKQLLDEKPRIRMIFAAAPSQATMLAELVAAKGIDWQRVTVFHMDEYIGLEPTAPQRFSHFLNTHLFDRVSPERVELIDSTNEVRAECQRYAQLLAEAPIDIVCLGIGENGHIAFNDPPVADFNDPHSVKVVELDDVCRQQQVNDGAFSSFNDVPSKAITLTIPTLMSGQHLYCVVPGRTKHDAIQKTLHGDITTDCPATILRTHPNCTLYVDTDAYGENEAQ